MPQITFDRWDGGMDLRKSASVSDANRLRDAKNVFITTGYQVKKRPGLLTPDTLESGTVGLVAYNGKLNTFYYNPAAPVTHADTDYVSHLLRYPGSAVVSLSKIHSVEVFNGFMYLAAEFTNGEVYHFYLDSDSAWAATTAYSLGDFVEPTTVNGLRYECTTDGTSGESEPTFPTAPGQTVADGSAVWTCRAKNVLDTNCPNHKSIAKGASKIWSPGSEVVRFCATNDARDWTSSADAGFLPTGIRASGDPVVQAVTRFRGQLAVVMLDATQLWDIDPDPSLHALDEELAVGTDKYRSFATLRNDSYLLTPHGFRSIADVEISQTIEDLDVGSPLDALVLADSDAGNVPDDVIGFFYRGGGQYLGLAQHAAGTRVYVFSQSKIGKLTAWSYYDYTQQFTDLAELANALYLRAGDDVYQVSNSVKSDAGVAYQHRAVMPYLAFKKPGQLKLLYGCDVVMQGRSDFRVLLDVNDASVATPLAEVQGDTRPGGMIPVDAATTEPGFEFIDTHDEDWELDLLTVYYALAGPM